VVRHAVRFLTLRRDNEKSSVSWKYILRLGKSIAHNSQQYNIQRSALHDSALPIFQAHPRTQSLIAYIFGAEPLLELELRDLTVFLGPFFRERNTFLRDRNTELNQILMGYRIVIDNLQGCIRF